MKPVPPETSSGVNCFAGAIGTGDIRRRTPRWWCGCKPPVEVLGTLSTAVARPPLSVRNTQGATTRVPSMEALRLYDVVPRAFAVAVNVAVKRRGKTAPDLEKPCNRCPLRANSW